MACKKAAREQAFVYGRFETRAIVSLAYSVLVTFWFALYAEVINTQYQYSLLAFERSKLEATHDTAEQIIRKLKEVGMRSRGSFH